MTAQAPPIGALQAGGARGRIDVRHYAALPRLTLVSRDGDATTALVVAVAIDAGSLASAALSAVLEGRLRAAGFSVSARADRASLRVLWDGADAPKAPAFLAALAAAFARPIASGTPELALVAGRVRALEEHPIEAPELTEVASCTGELALPSANLDRELDAAGVPRALETWRRASLHTGRASLGAVGPAAFCAAVANALEHSAGWAQGAPPDDPWPASDAVSVYASSAITEHAARVTVAVRAADPSAAVAASERLARADSPLALRLSNLPQPWRPTSVTGTARPRGGCVAVTVETTRHSEPSAREASSGPVVALVKREIAAELSGDRGSSAAARQILTATTASDAASRAAWWALAGTVPGAPTRTMVAVGLSAADHGGTEVGTSLDALAAEIARASAPVALDRRVAVERGQGELWLLLASPCGSSEEGTQDAATSALALLTAVASRRPSDIVIEPWITPDAVGLIAHAAPLDEHETPTSLARRVANEAARVLVASPLSTEGLATARSLALRQLERTAGQGGAALDAFLGAAAPEHPSWLEPLGPWGRTANVGLDAVRFRRQAVASGPLRIAVLANTDAAQGEAATEAVARWLQPQTEDGACRAGPAGPSKPGRYDAKLPRDTLVAQALVGLDVPPIGATGHDLAELTARALDGDGGILAEALGGTLGARASARLLGGARLAALVIDVRAPTNALDAAVSDTKTALQKLTQGGANEGAFTRATAAVAAQRRLSRADPRARLVETWRGAAPVRPAPTLAAWREWLATALSAPSLIFVEARPE